MSVKEGYMWKTIKWPTVYEVEDLGELKDEGEKTTSVEKQQCRTNFVQLAVIIKHLKNGCCGEKTSNRPQEVK